MTNSPPRGPLVILGDTDDTAEVGAQLVARASSVRDADGIPWGQEQYQWLRDGEAIEGATGKLYTVTEDDAGHRLSARMTYRDGGGTIEEVEAVPEEVVRVSAGGDEIRDAMRALYRLILGREPDDAGLRFWLGHLEAGMPVSEIARYMEQSDEARGGGERCESSAGAMPRRNRLPREA